MPKSTGEAVVLEILRQADGEWTGKTKLFKAFYFAHLYYGAERPGRLTSWPIARMPKGPGIHNSGGLFESLIADGLMTRESVHEGPYPEYRYRLTEKGWGALPMPEEASCAVQKAVLFCKEKTASELSQITHEYSRSWGATQNGQILDIDIDLIPDDEYLKREEEFEELDECLAKVFKEGSL